MRAGCFAETRVINLLNRRFVNFYTQTDNPGPGPKLGVDKAAAAFTKGKTKNVWAFYAAFTAGGEPVGVTDVYANKDNVFDFLVALLRENPDFDACTKEEQAALDKAKAEPNNARAQLEAGKILEELGRYKEARPHLVRVVEGKSAPDVSAEAYRALLRMARYGRDWPALRELCRKIDDPKLAGDVAAESAFDLLAQKKYAEVKSSLESAIKRHPDSKRLSEMRFYAGVACFFLKDKERAYYHWCWVVENLPDDRLARRSYIAAAHEGMPYKNPELGGFEARLPGGNIQVIQAAYDRAKEVYERAKGGE